MLAFLRNFWVCLALALVCAIMAAGSYNAEGGAGWAVFNGVIALLWLNDARRAMKREAESESEESV
jgi:hypothetical protein